MRPYPDAPGTAHATGERAAKGVGPHYRHKIQEESATSPAPPQHGLTARSGFLIIAADIVADLEAALEQFATIADDLKKCEQDGGRSSLSTQAVLPASDRG
jgi:hypothetical protein